MCENNFFVKFKVKFLFKKLRILVKFEFLDRLLKNPFLWKQSFLDDKTKLHSLIELRGRSDKYLA